MARRSPGTVVERSVCGRPHSSELAEKQPSRGGVPAGQVRKRALELVRVQHFVAEHAQAAVVSIADGARETLKPGRALLVEEATAAFVEERAELLTVGGSCISDRPDSRAFE